MTNPNVRWSEFLRHWPLWSLYIAHFAMNWSNYIIMQWLPTYLSRNLGANKESISLTAMPYIVNSLVGIGELLMNTFLYARHKELKLYISSNSAS